MFERRKRYRQIGDVIYADHLDRLNEQCQQRADLVHCILSIRIMGKHGRLFGSGMSLSLRDASGHCVKI